MSIMMNDVVYEIGYNPLSDVRIKMSRCPDRATPIHPHHDIAVPSSWRSREY